MDKKMLEKLVEQQRREIATLKAENGRLKKDVITRANNEKEFFAPRKLIALMPGHIFWKDKEGRLLGCNNNVARILSLTSPNEIIGKYNIDLIGKDLAQKVDLIDKQVIASGKLMCLEEIGFNENKEPAVYLSYKTPLCSDSGEVVGLLGTSLDITVQKQLEQELKIAKEKAEASDRAKSRFVAVINHELRTPLTGILGLVNFLKKSNLSEDEVKTTLEDLEICSQNLLNLVNDVLDFSQLEAGKYPAKTQTVVNLNDLIREVFGITNMLAKNKGLALIANLDKQLPDILTNGDTLRQILINIVNNAIKFTEKGHVTIHVNFLDRLPGKIKLKITIEDTGQGMAPDKLGLIFEPFHQLEETYTRQSSRRGTGLGLAVVKRLAALLKLEISVMSKLGAGSAFILTGEFETVESISTHLTKPVEPTLHAWNQKIKVLLVEDDKIVQRVHKHMLADLGCLVDTADTGADSLQLLNDHDIVFVDIGLPDMAGFEVIKAIRECQKNNLPIIALTGYTGEAEKTASLLAGADRIENKPISTDQLKEILMHYCVSPALPGLFQDHDLC